MHRMHAAPTLLLTLDPLRFPTVATSGGKPKCVKPQDVVLKAVGNPLRESAATAHRRRAREYEHTKRNSAMQRHVVPCSATFITRGLR